MSFPKTSKDTKNPYPPSDPTTRYAWDVVNRRIVAGDLAIRACRRHLEDMETGPKRGLFWKPERAKEALDFFPAVLRVTAGAVEGQPFNLPSYTTFVVGSLFGWTRADSRLRFREAWIEAAKGSVKSPVSAACGLYMMAFRGIARAECYAIAKDRNQANVLFADAVAMANAPIVGYDDGTSLVSCGTLIARGTGEMTWMLEHPASGSKFRALAGDEKVSGPRPSLVAADEIHEWRNDGPLRMWRSSGAKMPGDFLLLMTTNTPAADQLVGTEYSARYQRILRGEIDDDAAFAYIARVDEQDDPIHDETCWVKAMPCLDLTFPRENVRIEVNSSKHSMGTLLNTQRLYFGIPVGASEYWIDLDAWEAVQGRVDEEEMIDCPCWLGMDLALKNDLTALGAVWRDEAGMFHATVRYWKPAEGLALKAIEDNAPYVEWASATPPLLLLTPGKSIEYDFVAAEVERFCSRHTVEAMAFDPAHIDQFRQACDRIGFKTWIWRPDEPAGDGLKMVVHSQGRAGMHSKRALWMPRSLGQFEDAILTGNIVVDESQLTKWCAGNAACEADQQGNRYFVKKNTRGRKDGMDALAMAIGAALSELGAEPEPEYSMFFVGGGSGQGARPPRGFA
jgi:phage terminase large subunit-like protein